MTTTPSTSGVPIATETVQLAPSYALPIALVLIAIPTVLLQPWVAGILALFGLFLLFQTATLRLLLTVTALDIYRGETLIRRFPYQDWQIGASSGLISPFCFIFEKLKASISCRSCLIRKCLGRV